MAKIKKIPTEGFIVNYASDGCDRQYIKSLPTYRPGKVLKMAVKIKMAAKNTSKLKIVIEKQNWSQMKALEAQFAKI